MMQPDGDVGWPVTRFVRIGIFASIVLLAGFGTWIARANIAGAIVTNGRLEITEEPQIIQHATGGVVERLNVREGDLVQTDDVLIRLDAKLVQSRLKIVNHNLYETMARKARLVAERDGAAISFDAVLTTLSRSDATIAVLLDDQTRQLNSTNTLQKQFIDGMREKTAQIASQVIGIRAQKRAIVDQQTLVAEQLQNKSLLVDRGLTPVSSVLALRREAAVLAGRLGVLNAEIAEAAERTAEIKIEILKIRSVQIEQAIILLRDLELREIELRENRQVLQQTLNDHTIRAPIAGTALGLIPLSPGSVIPSASTLLAIVPETRRFVVRTRILPANINQIYPGQRVRIRFAMLGSVDATGTDFAGMVKTVSPDTLNDLITGKSYFRVEVEFSDADASNRSSAFTFTPGMPVEVYFATSIQPVWAYLAKPLRAYISRAFRET